MKNKITDSFICEIASKSHILNKSAFAFLLGEGPLTRVIEVKRDSLKIEVRATEDMAMTWDKYIQYAFLVASNFLMAINIGSLGHFTWSVGSHLFWECEHCKKSGLRERIFIHAKDILYPGSKRELAEAEVKNAVIILGSLLREKNQGFRKEYLKGITHMNAGFADLVYYRESFANFYRSFEYFITTKILKLKRLKNELKDLQYGIKAIGLKENFQDEFRNLYRIRSEQVMHAQKEQKEIDTDDVFKIKTFTDFAYHQYYRKIADTWLENQKSPTNKDRS